MEKGVKKTLNLPQKLRITTSWLLAQQPDIQTVAMQEKARARYRGFWFLSNLRDYTARKKVY